MTVSKPETVEVTQADRDAAADCLERTALRHTAPRFAADMRAGHHDSNHWVQDFARHRLNATPSRQDGLREALERLVEKLQSLSRQNAADPLLQEWADNRVEEIRAALSDTPPPDNEETEALREADPDLGKIAPGHICKHGVRWPHPCAPCDEAAWQLHQSSAFRKTLIACAVPLAILFVGSNWVSMNLGYEYGADTGGCIAFDMLTELPVAEIPMCDRAVETWLYRPRIAWVWLHGDMIPTDKAAGQ